jgi:hypothetical protein
MKKQDANEGLSKALHALSLDKKTKVQNKG